MLRPVVDLPQPDSPTSASVSPARSVKLTCSTACTRAASAAEEAAPKLEARRRVGAPPAPASAVRTVACGSGAGPPGSGNGSGSVSSRRRRAPAPRRAAPACRDAPARRRCAATVAFLDLLAVVHHDDAVGHLGDHAHVVRDEDHPHAVSRPAATAISRRICAWTVTSSAVVGSSAISRRGRHDSAIAIITRCRMPPESWCG